MSVFREETVFANGIHIHYWRAGQAGGLPVVLLHGVTDNGACWKPIADALLERGAYELIMPDSRGHGLSEAPQSGYDYTTRAADVAGLIRALGLDHPVVMGHSMGAETAIAVAVLFPDLVRAAVLEDPPWFPANAPESSGITPQWLIDGLQNRPKTRAKMLEKGRAENPNWPEAETQVWADAQLQVRFEITQTAFTPRKVWQEYVSQVRCPVLLITADPARGAIVTSQTVAEVQRVFQNGQIVNIPGAGHCIHREKRYAYIDIVQEFLSRLTG